MLLDLVSELLFQNTASPKTTSAPEQRDSQFSVALKIDSLGFLGCVLPWKPCVNLIKSGFYFSVSKGGRKT